MPKKGTSKKRYNKRGNRSKNYEHVNDFKKGQIFAHWEDGKNKTKISHIIGVPRTTVNRIIKKFEKDGHADRKDGSGRKRKTNKRQDAAMVRESKKDPFLTAADIQRIVNSDYGIEVSHDTINRRLIEAGLPSRVARKKPFISDPNIQKRLEWCIKYQDWTVDQWKRVLFCDESAFTLVYHGRVLVRRPPGKKAAYDKKYIKPTIKHGGGKINVWGCFCYDGVGDLHKIDGIMVCIFFATEFLFFAPMKTFSNFLMKNHNVHFFCQKKKQDAEKYRQILIHHASTSGIRLIGRGFVFAQDNDPKHTANVCKNYLRNKQNKGDLAVLDWPSQSPDINPIENLWQQIKLERRKIKATSKDDLYEKIKTIWDNFPIEKLQNLIESMPDRIKAVINAKGGHTKY